MYWNYVKYNGHYVSSISYLNHIKFNLINLNNKFYDTNDDFIKSGFIIIMKIIIIKYIMNLLFNFSKIKSFLHILETLT